MLYLIFAHKIEWKHSLRCNNLFSKAVFAIRCFKVIIDLLFRSKMIYLKIMILSSQLFLKSPVYLT